MVEAIEDLVGGGYWSYAPKRMAFLKWACLTYFGLKRAVLTHDVYKPQILLRMTSRLIKYLLGPAVDGESMSYGIYVPTQWE